MPIQQNNTHQHVNIVADFAITDLPPVKPSAIALGTIFNHSVELAGMSIPPSCLYCLTWLSY
jgi:hypothetical protein